MKVVLEALFVIMKKLETVYMSITGVLIKKNHDMLIKYNMVQTLKSILSVIYIHYPRKIFLIML